MLFTPCLSDTRTKLLTVNPHSLSPLQAQSKRNCKPPPLPHVIACSPSTFFPSLSTRFPCALGRRPKPSHTLHYYVIDPRRRLAFLPRLSCSSPPALHYIRSSPPPPAVPRGRCGKSAVVAHFLFRPPRQRRVLDGDRRGELSAVYFHYRQKVVAILFGCPILLAQKSDTYHFFAIRKLDTGTRPLVEGTAFHILSGDGESCSFDQCERTHSSGHNAVPELEKNENSMCKPPIGTIICWSSQ